MLFRRISLTKKLKMTACFVFLFTLGLFSFEGLGWGADSEKEDQALEKDESRGLIYRMETESKGLSSSILSGNINSLDSVTSESGDEGVLLRSGELSIPMKVIDQLSATSNDRVLLFYLLTEMLENNEECREEIAAAIRLGSFDLNLWRLAALPEKFENFSATSLIKLASLLARENRQLGHSEQNLVLANHYLVRAEAVGLPPVDSLAYKTYLKVHDLLRSPDVSLFTWLAWSWPARSAALISYWGFNFSWKIKK